jgi:hypothetical protein
MAGSDPRRLSIQKMAQVVGKKAGRDAAWTRIAPPHPYSVIGARPRVHAHFGAHGGRAQRISKAARLEDDGRFSFTCTYEVEPAPDGIHEPTRRGKSVGVTPNAHALVHRACQRQREEDAENGQD